MSSNTDWIVTWGRVEGGDFDSSCPRLGTSVLGSGTADLRLRQLGDEQAVLRANMDRQRFAQFPNFQWVLLERLDIHAG